ncbi:MAG TPA: hypothetical protein VJB99_04255 [Patescibacteria group bacterium]|nr:hypothetical protein [Patescibacteria group bacterium]
MFFELVGAAKSMYEVFAVLENNQLRSIVKIGISKKGLLHIVVRDDGLSNQKKECFRNIGALEIANPKDRSGMDYLFWVALFGEDLVLDCVGVSARENPSYSFLIFHLSGLLKTAGVRELILLGGSNDGRPGGRVVFVRKKEVGSIFLPLPEKTEFLVDPQEEILGFGEVGDPQICGYARGQLLEAVSQKKIPAPIKIWELPHPLSMFGCICGGDVIVTMRNGRTWHQLYHLTQKRGQIQFVPSLGEPIEDTTHIGQILSVTKKGGVTHLVAVTRRFGAGMFERNDFRLVLPPPALSPLAEMFG